MIEGLIAETGGDAESFGVLGRIYKDRWNSHREKGDEQGATANLDRAIDAYRRGFEREPSNYYPGINLATMLLLRGTAGDRTALKATIPRVRAALDAKTTDGRADYWQVATRLELDVLAGEWDSAADVAGAIAAAGESPWMVESTVRQLQLLEPALSTDVDRQRLHGIVERLRVGAPGGTAYA